MAKGDLIPEFKRAWIEALRSGEYEQGRARLFRDGQFCCLGVAADLLCGLEAGGLEVFGADVEGREFYSGLRLPGEVCEALGFDEAARDALIVMNDSDRKSFSEIANYIEENL